MPTMVGDLVVKLRGDTVQFEGAMTSAAARMKKMGTQMTSIGRGISMSLSLPLLAAGAAATKLSVDFDMALSKVVGLVGLSRDEVAGFRDEILKLGPTVGKASKELAEALFFVTSAGIRGEAVMKTVEVAAKGAAAGLGETAVVADAATSAMNAYAGANMDAEMATSILVATVREGKAEASSLAPVLGRILPVAANLGIGFDQVGAALASMTRLGFDAATSATSLRATMVQLTKTTPAQEKAALAMGLSFERLRKTIREDGLLAGLQQIKDAVGEDEVAMTKIFPNVRALSGVLAMMGDSAEATTGIFQRMAKTTTDDLAVAFAAAEEQAGFKFKQALVSLQNLLIRIGDDVLPMLVPQVEKLTVSMQEWASKWKELSPGLKDFILKASGLAIVLGPLLIVLGSITTALAGLFTVVAKVAGLISAVTGIGAVTTAITGTTTAAVGAGAALTAAETAIIAAGTAATSASVAFLAATAGTVALGAAIGVLAGSIINHYLMKWDMLQQVLGNVADQYFDISEAMTKSKDAYESQLHVTQMMIKSLGLEGKQWELQAEHTQANAERLSRVTEEVTKLAREKSTLGRQMKDLIAISDEEASKQEANSKAVTEAAEEETAAQSAYLDELKKKYDVLSKDDIAAQMNSIAADFNSLKDTVDKTQLAEKFNEPMLLMAKMAAENKVAIPQPFKDAADHLGDKLVPGMRGLIDASVNFRNDFTNTGKVIDGIMWSTGETVEAALSGGFKQGITNGIEGGKVAMTEFVQRIEDTVIYIPVQPNLEGWNQAIQDAIAGRVPNTAG